MKNKLIRNGYWGLTLALLCSAGSALAIEKPEYEVLMKVGDIEYRQYAPYVVAQTWVDSSSDYNTAALEGFQRLFDYISGDNQGQAKIAMTAPVQQNVESVEIDMTAPVQSAIQDQGWVISFMLPAKFTLGSAPIPDDSRIEIAEVPGKLVAVKRFSGRWTTKNFDKQSARLAESLEAINISQAGAIVSAVYNPPFMPPFLRRNEVMVQVNSIPST